MDRSHQDDSIKPAANTPEGDCHADGSAPLVQAGQKASGNPSASKIGAVSSVGLMTFIPLGLLERGVVQWT